MTRTIEATALRLNAKAADAASLAPAIEKRTLIRGPDEVHLRQIFRLEAVPPWSIADSPYLAAHPA